ncbi:MAG: hypothetical protein M5U30_10575 [Burkholderiaceae bacterium]|nr:hypothetical protein [Burkholderiaceae bacterium]
MPNLSVRGVDPSTLAALKAVAGKEGVSVNTLVLRLIDQALGKGPATPTRRRHDDLDGLVGAWSAEEAAEFEAATAALREIDSELWR